MLRSTVARLASHRGARTNYVVVLAMEGTEKGHEAKANVLYHDFRGRFKDLVVSVHPAGIPGEARGKGSNGEEFGDHGDGSQC